MAVLVETNNSQDDKYHRGHQNQSKGKGGNENPNIILSGDGATRRIYGRDGIVTKLYTHIILLLFRIFRITFIPNLNSFIKSKYIFEVRNKTKQ